MKRLNNILFSFFCFLTLNTFAQVGVKPLNYGLKSDFINHNARISNIGDTITLPFVDDFTTNGNKLNTNLWINSGVYINNTNCINPPTYNVATFDGIDSTGNPYNFYNGFSYGPCDKLESKFIKLDTANAKKKLILSFFWQSGGLIEAPDSIQTDSLALFVLSKNSNQWIKVWSVSPNPLTDDSSLFNFESVTLHDTLRNVYQKDLSGNPTNVLHSDFKFKFQSFGNQSGAWDNWHLDYIRLVNADTILDKNFIDFSMGTLSNKLLKNYSAITYEQFTNFEDQELIDSITVKNVNLGAGFKVLSYHSDFKKDGIIFDSNEEQFSTVTLPYPKFYSKNILLDKTKFKNLASTSFSYPITFTSNFINSVADKDINFRNDTTIVTSLVTNYLSYDDGSAEGAFGINQAAGRIANKFKLNIPDTLSSIDINWVKSVNNLNGSTFKLLILNKLKEVVYTKQVSLVYGDSINTFINYELDSAIILSDSFYIGYEQNSSNVLTVGFDKNTISNSSIFYAIDYISGTNNYNWKSFNKTQGSLMLRPVFQRGVKLGTQRIDNTSKNEISLYPNPSKGLFTILNDSVDYIKVYNLIGNEIDSNNYKLIATPNKSQQIDLTLLETGFYIVYLYHDNKLSILKVFIQP